MSEQVSPNERLPLHAEDTPPHGWLDTFVIWAKPLLLKLGSKQELSFISNISREDLQSRFPEPNMSEEERIRWLVLTRILKNVSEEKFLEAESKFPEMSDGDRLTMQESLMRLAYRLRDFGDDVLINISTTRYEIGDLVKFQYWLEEERSAIVHEGHAEIYGDLLEAMDRVAQGKFLAEDARKIKEFKIRPKLASLRDRLGLLLVQRLMGREDAQAKLEEDLSEFLLVEQFESLLDQMVQKGA